MLQGDEWTVSWGDPWSVCHEETHATHALCHEETHATHALCHEAIRRRCDEATRRPCIRQHAPVQSVKLHWINGRPLLVSHLQVFEPTCISSPSWTTDPLGPWQLGPERTECMWTLRPERTVFADIRARKDRVYVDVKAWKDSVCRH